MKQQGRRKDIFYEEHLGLCHWTHTQEESENNLKFFWVNFYEIDRDSYMTYEIRETLWLIDKNGKLESVYKEEEPHKNLINDRDYQNLIFYQLFPDTAFDNSIYIGTEEEKMEYFHKNYYFLSCYFDYYH